MSENVLSLPEETENQQRLRKRGMFFLALAIGAVGFTMMLQMALNANFLVDDINISGLQNGQIEAARESCGIIAFLILALLAGLAEPIVGAFMLVLVGVGLGSYAFVPKDYLWVLGLSLVWSQGLHVWMPLPNSMALSLAEKGRTGFRLGQLASAGAVGSFLALALALGLHYLKVPIRPMYVVAGCAAILGAVACFGIPRNIKTPGPRLVFRRKYGLYYTLCLMEGWRKQIFMAFAGYMLVRLFHTSLPTMLTLWATTMAVGFFTAPQIGKLIDRFGERRVLLNYYVLTIIIFCGYAAVPLFNADPKLLLYVLYALFVLDGSLFALAAALTTYVNRIAPPAEHTATLSMGVAMNHVAAVTMPLVGGILWQVSPVYTFLLGTIGGVMSIAAVLRLPRHEECKGSDVIRSATATATAASANEFDA